MIESTEKAHAPIRLQGKPTPPFVTGQSPYASRFKPVIGYTREMDTNEEGIQGEGIENKTKWGNNGRE